MPTGSDGYYSCEYLCSLKDENRETPDIFIADGNRTAGKSFSFKTKLMNAFLKADDDIKEFVLVYRNLVDISDIAASFYGDIAYQYPGHIMEDKPLFKGAARVLLLDGKTCGYAVALSNARKLKKNAALFYNVKHMFFDEYQDEDDMYLTNEVEKLMSFHTTIARGHGKNIRRVPLYMTSNTVSILNPYYSALGISKKLRSNTKILRGDGWVFEKTFNENASKSFRESAFNRAFSKSRYVDYASQNVYLNDNDALIERPTGHSEYILSVRYNMEWYNVRKYSSLIYISEGYDASFPRRVTFRVDDVVDDRATMVASTSYIVTYLRQFFNVGAMRFQNIKCKNMMFDFLAFI